MGFLLTTNAIFWLVGWYYDAARPWVNIDYLLILPLLLFRKKLTNLMALLVFLVIFSLDCLLWIRQFFPFLTLADVSTLGPLVLEGPPVYKYLLCFGSVMGLVTFSILYSVAQTLKNREVIGMCVMLSALWAYFSGTTYQSKEATLYETTGLVESQLMYAHKLKDNFVIKSFNWTAKFSQSPYTSILQTKLDQPTSSQVVFIIMESWGAFTNTQHQERFISRFKSQLAPTEFFTHGTSDFLGATVNGELRELCGLQVSHYNLERASIPLQSCLPHKLRQQNYHTLAMHAANSAIYDRGIWYKDAGFQHTLFFEQLKSPSFCRSFPGKCDIELFYELDNALMAHPKLFFYWLTLNSHYPYKNADITQEELNCNDFDISRDTEACRNILLNNQFLSQLSKKSYDSHYKNVEFIIVGDHQPPIMKSVSNTPVFKKDTVSWLHFKIK